jgi:hypothetical protein
MRITKVELYDKYYSTYPKKAHLYKEDTEMPNHCYNRVTFYSSNEEDVAKLKKIFEDENCFGQIIPEPDWANTPVMLGHEMRYGMTRANLGELPVYTDGAFGKQLRFPSTDQPDDRWYDWRLQHWDTKWDAYDVEILDDDEENLQVGFNTAWSPPEAICRRIREDYPDVSVSWFYDEPGEEIAGYL